MPMPSVKPTGVTAIETTVGALTVTWVVADRVPRVAEIPVVPAALPVSKPEALTTAIEFEFEPQVTSAVISALLPSL
jgi:hypothetical protein